MWQYTFMHPVFPVVAKKNLIRKLHQVCICLYVKKFCFLDYVWPSIG